jgi:hypothetical protein
VLHLDARVWDRLQVVQFQTWGNAWGIEALTERPDVLELVLREPGRSPTGA